MSANRESTEKALDAAVDSFVKSDLKDKKTAGIMKNMLGVSMEDSTTGKKNSTEPQLFVEPCGSKNTKSISKSNELTNSNPLDSSFTDDSNFLQGMIHFEKNKAHKQETSDFDGIVDTDMPYYDGTSSRNQSNKIADDEDMEDTLSEPAAQDNDDNEDDEKEENIDADEESSLGPLHAKPTPAPVSNQAISQINASTARQVDDQMDQEESYTYEAKPKPKSEGFTSSLFSFASQFVEALEDTITFISTGKEPQIRPTTNRLRRRREETVIRLLSDLFAVADEDKDGKISKEQAWDIFALMVLKSKHRSEKLRLPWDDEVWEVTKVDFADVLAYYPKKTLSHTAWCDFISEVELDDDTLLDVLTEIIAAPLPKVSENITVEEEN